MHGMSDGTDPNRAEAIYVDMQRGDQQITTDEAEARVDQAKWIAEGHTGLSPTALLKFGNALHIITDRLSPAHAGYQPWYGQSKLNPSTWLHYLHEALGPKREDFCAGRAGRISANVWDGMGRV